MPCGLAVSIGSPRLRKCAALGAEALDYFQQMGERAGQPIDPHHHQGVPRADPLEAAREFDAAAAAAGGALLEDYLATGPQRIELRAGLLLLSGDPGVADQGSAGVARRWTIGGRGNRSGPWADSGPSGGGLSIVGSYP